MANDALTTTGGSGSQATTQSPQSAVQPANTGTQSSSVQPGTATALLSTGQGGVAMQSTALSTVSLAGASTGTAAKPISVAKHHANPVIFGFSALLLIVAAVLFWTTSRSVKNTTHY